MAYPILAPNSTWYKSSVARSTITQINIVDSYTPTGSENETWNADVNNTGSIKCYRTGTVITMAGNSSGKIAANADSSYMFSSTSSSNRLTSLLAINGLSFLDASGVTNMMAVFYGCSKMTTIDLSNWSANNVTSTTAMFARCTSLENVELSNLVGGSVTQANSMFQSCSALNSIDVSQWDTSGIANFRQMFLECSSLTTLDVSNWDTSNATNMSDMFKDCSSLTTLDVSNWDVSKVTTMEYMFSYCISLTTLDVSKWDVSKVTTMRSMFSMSNYGAVASPLTELDVSNWDTSSCTDMGWMFYGCNGIKTLDLSKWDVSKVEVLHHFAAHAYIELIGVENWDVSNCRAFNATFYSCQNTSLDLSGWDVSKGVTFAQMFEGSGSLIEIKGLENWNTSNGRDFAEMFLNCPSLKKLNLSSFDTRNASSSYTDEWNSDTGSMNNMFGNLTSLDKIILGENFSFNGDGTAAPAVLPTPDATYISGADGNWYDEDGNPYAVTAIPNGVGTYYASLGAIDVIYLIKRPTLVGIAKATRSLTGAANKMTPETIKIAIEESIGTTGVNITFEDYSVIDDGNGNITITR